MTEARVLPEIEAILPHAGPMRLVSRVVSHTRERTICAVDVGDSELFRDADGFVPAWVVLEWMAQTVAAHGALLDGLAGATLKPGLLVGAKQLELLRDRFASSDSLEVTARILQRVGRLASLACEARLDGELVATSTLSVFVPDSLPEARP